MIIIILLLHIRALQHGRDTEINRVTVISSCRAEQQRNDNMNMNTSVICLPVSRHITASLKSSVNGSSLPVPDLHMCRPDGSLQ